MSTPVSGIRWYRGYPTQLTQLVIAGNATLYTGGDPVSTYPYAPLTQIQTFTSQNATKPVTFASMRDPRVTSDVLVICGFTGPYGFATAELTLAVFSTGDVFTVQFTGPISSTVGNYTVTANDTAQTIVEHLVSLTNLAVTNNAIGTYVNLCYNDTSTIFFGAQQSGAGGNAITVQFLRNGAGVGSPLSFVGGGTTSSAPLKYDGTTVSGLSYQITRPFTNVYAWHDHLWFWGDPAAPDTLFASDINRPEGFVFMIQEGGYDIGVGDGDADVRAVAAIGNIMYVFKSAEIYAISGYDFQSGEYRFNLQPAIQGYGAPTQQCVTTNHNAVYFWTGRIFARLQVGAFDVENISRTIPFTCGLVSNGNANLVQAVAGDFFTMSSLNESFTASTKTTGSEIFSSVVMFAVDVGNGVPDTVLVYDDEATQLLGNYAWAPWKGWNVGAWIPFGGGPSSEGAPAENPILCWVPPLSTTSGNPVVNAYGTNVAADSGLPITWSAQTGWVTLTTAALSKELHRIFLELESTPGVIMSLTITPAVTATQAGFPTIYSPQTLVFGSTGGTPGAEFHQTLIASVNPFLRANAYLFSFAEKSGTSTYEVLQMVLDYIEEAFQS